jgi:hypothetical protein
LRNASSASNAAADALILYFSLNNNLTLTPYTPGVLTPYEVDQTINRLDGSFEKNSSLMFIMSRPTKYSNDIIVGSALKIGMNSEPITSTTKSVVINSNVSAAVIISDYSLDTIDVINVFILGDPTAYQKLPLSKNKFLVSSMIVVDVRGKENQSLTINITLYFQVLNNTNSHKRGKYLCSYLDTDTDTAEWNESGCTEPQYIEEFGRYECNCSHLTSFGLIWLIDTQPDQDIASLIFLSLSILCFIAVIVHSITIRLVNPLASLRPRDLLPLLSSASTTLLFIFYIALGMTVYTRTTSESGTKCFLSSSVLMFFVYFFLIFMFCAKTSVGYFNYLRFVYLFPEPSNRKLFVSLIISFFIAITWTSFAAGFNSNPSYNITQFYPYELCWFTRDVIHYFLTIPVCIFLLLNLLTIIFVAKHIINHVRRATSPHQSYERMKRCVLVLLSSCATQGIGWLFGLFTLFGDSTAPSSKVLGWFFVIFNGLEGVWSILLYIIIRSQLLEEARRVNESKEHIKKTSSVTVENKKRRRIHGFKNALARRFRATHQTARKDPIVFNDLYNEESIDWETSTCEA